MKSILIAGHYGKGAGGALIKWFTDRPFSHVSFVFIDGSEVVMEYESIQGKGVIRHVFDARAFKGELFELPCSQHEAETIMTEAERLVGSKYDWKAIFGFFLRRDLNDPEKVICSEYVPWCCQKAKIMLQRMRLHKQNPGMVCASPRIEPSPEMLDVLRKRRVGRIV